VLDGQDLAWPTVVLVAAAVGGERLWHMRRWIPPAVPAALDEGDEVDRSRTLVAGPLFTIVVFCVFAAACLLLPGGQSVLLGFLAGFAVRDTVMAVRVAWWQRRHRRILAWRDDGDRVEPLVLARGRAADGGELRAQGSA
jgi:hypothetical protein